MFLLDLGNSENQSSRQLDFHHLQLRILTVYCGYHVQQGLVLETLLGQPENDEKDRHTHRKVEIRWAVLALLESHQLCNKPEMQTVSYEQHRRKSAGVSGRSL